MRHRVKIKKLTRSQGHYRALMANLAGALIEHKEIKTTLSKAKELRPYIEKLITHSKEDSVHKRRIIFKKMNSRKYVYELFHVIGPKNVDRDGGYTRILKLGKRRGDGAEMALIQLLGFETFVESTKSKKAKKEAPKEDKPLLDIEADEVKAEKVDVAKKKDSSKKKKEEIEDVIPDAVVEEKKDKEAEVVEEEPVKEVTEAEETEKPADSDDTIVDENENKK